MSEPTLMRISWDLHAELSQLKQKKQAKEKRQISFEEIILDLLKEVKQEAVACP